MSEQNVDTVRRLYDAAQRRDLERFISLHDPDATVVPLILNIEGRAYHGHGGLRRFWEEIHAAFPDWHWEADEVRGLGDGALVKMRICGHGSGSGVTIEEPGWHLLEIRTGKVVWWRVFRTESEALEAAGLRARPPSTANAEVVRRTIDAFNRAGVEGTVPFLHPDVEWYTPPEWLEERCYRGIEGMRQLEALWRRAFVRLRWEIESLEALGEDGALVLIVQRGQTVEDLDVEQRMGLVYHLRERRVARIDAYFSWEQAREAVSSWPPPAS